MKFSPWTSVRYKVSGVGTDLTVNFAPIPVVYLASVSSIVRTSPTQYPIPALPEEASISVISPLVTVSVAVAPLPSPVNVFNLTPLVLLNAYPDPPLIFVIEFTACSIGPATFSTIPVILSSSLSLIVPVLIFLPIATSAAEALPFNLTFNFLGKVLIGLSDNTWVFSLPASTGVL